MNGRRTTAAWILCVLCVLSGLSAWWWRARTREQLFRAALPPTPSLTGYPAELAQRVATAESLARRGSGSAVALADLAQLYHANGFLPEAAQCYRGLAQLEPRNARWPHRLACLYAGFGELDSALPLFQRAVRLAPDYLPARVRLGDALLKLNRPAEAADAYAAVLVREPENAFALTGLARVDLAAGRAVAAREKLERAAAASGGRIGADLLATVYEQTGAVARAAALRASAKASGAFHDPLDPWMDEIFDDCFDVYRVTVAAGFADHAGDPTRARRLIDRALALDPKNASALYQRGLWALARVELAAAQRDFEACVAAAPDYADGWWRLVEVATKRGDAAGAARTLAAGLARCPDSPTLHLERATRLAAANRSSEALAEFETVIRLRPSDADALVKMAELLFRLERVDEGVAALRRALAAEPEHPLALLALALHAINSGNEREARALLGRVRDQVRTPDGAAEALAEEFHKRFGSSP